MPEIINFDLFHPEPLLIIVSGPSCVGKDAVVRLMEKRRKTLHFVVTYTDRTPRPEENNGVDYFFITTQDFLNKVSRNFFLEYSLVYDQYKGIPRDQFENAMASKKDLLMRIDVQGVEKVKSIFPEAITIFLIPSNQQEWEERLKQRKGDKPEEIQKRIQTATEELDQIPRFDYLVVNVQNRLEDTANTILAIIDAEHHRIPPSKNFSLTR